MNVVVLLLLFLAIRPKTAKGGKGGGTDTGPVPDTGEGWPVDPNPRSDHGWFEGYPYGIEPMAGGGYAVVVVVGGVIGPDPSKPISFQQSEHSVATYDAAQVKVAAVTANRGTAPVGLPWPPWWPEDPEG